MGEHYHLACGGETRVIPYKQIGENQKNYIQAKYLPPKTTFLCPRNIPIHDLKSLFDFFLQRQRDHGSEDTFIFKSIKVKGITVPSVYKIMNSSDSSEDAHDTGVENSVSGPGLCPTITPSPGPDSGPDHSQVNSSRPPARPPIRPIPGPGIMPLTAQSTHTTSSPGPGSGPDHSQVDSPSPPVSNPPDRPRPRPITRSGGK
jgi:hypothetical protein